MFAVHEFEQASMNFAWSRFFRDALTPEIVHMMQSGGDVDDQAAYQFLMQNPSQTFYEELSVFGVNSIKDLLYSRVREITADWGFRMRVACALNKSGPWMDGLFCQHMDGSDWRALVANDAAHLLLPVMANSVDLGRTLGALRSRFQASLSVLDALGLGVFLVDARGCVIEQNKEAQRILDTRDGIALSADKRIRLHTADTTAALAQMVDGANGLLRGEIAAHHSLIAAPRPSGAYDYLISVRALSDSTAELERGLKCAFVTIIDPERENLSVEGVTALGHLSGAEADVVSLLVQGLRLSDVAQRRDVSTNTIKTQLSVISQKLRCSGQSDIIRVAAATRMPIEK